MKRLAFFLPAILLFAACMGETAEERETLENLTEEPSVEVESLLEGNPALEDESPDSYEVEDGVTSGLYEMLELNTADEYPPESLEGVPPIFTYYFREDGSLAVAYVRIGHEIWLKEFAYIFDANEEILQFSDRSIDRPDNPSDLNNFYKDGIATQEDVELPLPAEEILELFHSESQPSQKQLEGFNRY